MFRRPIRQFAITTLVGFGLLAVTISPASAAVAMPVHTKALGDCTLSTHVTLPTVTSAIGNGSVTCSKSHSSIALTTVLKVTRTDGSVVGPTASVNAANTTATRAATVAQGYRGCVLVQSVVTVTISGLGSDYQTTGKPMSSCAITPTVTQARTLGESMAAKDGFSGSQWTCLSNLWNRESGWRYNASNASSGAYGIPQALPGSKMGSVAADWHTNAETQIRWGLNYIEGRYVTPCGAWNHSQSYGWY